MALTVIIAHFAPEPRYREVLKHTIRSIRTQRFTGPLEIIVTDDGSQWSAPLVKSKQETRIFDSEEIRNEPLLHDLNISKYILKRQNGFYNKASLWNSASRISSSNKLVFLDDDHAFCRDDSLYLFDNYLNLYDFVLGTLISADGRPRLFHSRQVQGTTFAMRRDLLNSVGGFGEYSSRWGRGEDSDIFWKIYTASNKGKRRLACYSSRIVTRDLCSGRWKQMEGSDEIFIAEFTKLFGVHPHRNPSRFKRSWIDYADFRSYFIEKSRLARHLVRCLSQLSQRTSEQSRMHQSKTRNLF